MLAGLTGYQLTRGVLCAMRRPKLPTMEEICREASRVVILENVQNPTNVGAIFRSAAAVLKPSAFSCCIPASGQSPV